MEKKSVQALRRYAVLMGTGITILASAGTVVTVPVYAAVTQATDDYEHKAPDVSGGKSYKGSGDTIFEVEEISEQKYKIKVILREKGTGKRISNATIKAVGPNNRTFIGVTDENGEVIFEDVLADVDYEFDVIRPKGEGQNYKAFVPVTKRFEGGLDINLDLELELEPVEPTKPTEPTKPEPTKPEPTKPRPTRPSGGGARPVPEPKPKPQETRPQETRPQETRPQETRPQETKPQETRPQESQPESRPAAQKRPSRPRPSGGVKPSPTETLEQEETLPETETETVEETLPETLEETYEETLPETLPEPEYDSEAEAKPCWISVKDCRFHWIQLLLLMAAVVIAERRLRRIRKIHRELDNREEPEGRREED